MVGGRGRRPGLAGASLFLATAALGACRADPESGALMVRDSAGVEIVESFAPAWEPGEGWSVAPQPRVRIGVIEGASPYQLSDVAGAVRLSDGTLVAADGAAQEVRFYDSAGTFLRSVGGPGGGPGEFTGLSGLGAGRHDRIWAWDFSLRRITWLDAEGRITSIASLGPEPPVLSPVGALPNGAVVLRQLWGARAMAEAGHTGLRRDPVAFVTFDSAGTLLDTVGVFPGREVFVTGEGGRGVMNVPVAGRNSVGTVRAGGVVVGTQETFELREYGADGTLWRVLRLPGRDSTVTEREVRALIRRRVEEAPPEHREALRAALEAQPIPRTRPAYEGVLADAEGNIWVAPWGDDGEAAKAWTVLDAQGRWLGAVTLPDRFHPFQIGNEWLLGVETDGLGVEYLTLYRLIRSPRSS